MLLLFSVCSTTSRQRVRFSRSIDRASTFDDELKRNSSSVSFQNPVPARSWRLDECEICVSSQIVCRRVQLSVHFEWINWVWAAKKKRSKVKKLKTIFSPRKVSWSGWCMRGKRSNKLITSPSSTKNNYTLSAEDKNHMSRALSRTMKLPNAEKPFQCNVCEKQVSWKFEVATSHHILGATSLLRL